MKRQRRRGTSLYLGLAVLVAVEIILAVVVANLISRLMGMTMDMYPLTFILLGSVVVGAIAAGFLAKWLFDPIAGLGKAMDRVAAGNFSVRVETKSGFRQIRDIYANFNLMARELEATEILQTDFVSNVSHEFKTPINAIEGYATLLQGAGQTEAEREEYTGRILLSTRRLSELVGNILLLSRLDNRAIQSRRTSFSLDEQIRQVIILLEPKWSKKDIDFDVDMEEIAWQGDESLLMQVWSNLIDNAVKFDPEGGLVRIRLFRREGQAVFTIDDSGPGIEPEKQKHIFDKFYQADSSHKEEGNGLGLALVERILGLCGGSITVENLPGGGCRFTVLLPEEE